MKFGCFREAKKILLQSNGYRLLTDFTGEGYRMIIELPYASLVNHEADLKKELGGTDWKDWYEKFKEFIRYSK